MAFAAEQNEGPLSISKEGVVVWHAVRVASNGSTNSFTGSDRNLSFGNFMSQCLQLLLCASCIDKLSGIQELEEFTDSPKENCQ